MSQLILHVTGIINHFDSSSSHVYPILSHFYAIFMPCSPVLRAVFQVVERHSGSPEGRQSLTGRLNLVDLAGSERPRLTGAERPGTPGMEGKAPKISLKP
jgi:hypothetical protein